LHPRTPTTGRHLSPAPRRGAGHDHARTAQELLGPRLTKGEARPLETQAKRHYKAAGRNLAKFAADLRRLQDGEAHLTRGFSSFGAYAEHTFDGLSAANAKKISIQGAVLLALEHHQRITLDDTAGPLPGATGPRALATVLTGAAQSGIDRQRPHVPDQAVCGAQTPADTGRSGL
jgi:hypothetical protein